MHISRIAVAGFRNFRDLDINDLPSAIVLVGENRSGKSNLLHALRLVLDPSLPDTARDLVEEDFWDGLSIPFGGNQITVTVELADFDGDQNAMALLQDFLVRTAPNVAQLTYAYRPRPLAAASTSPVDYEWVLYGGGRDDQRVGRTVLKYVSIRVLPALRDAEGDLGSARSPLRRLLARAEVDPKILAKVTTGITGATGVLLSDRNIAAIKTGINDRLAAMVGDVFAITTTLGIAPADAEQLIRAIRLFLNEVKQRDVGQTSLGMANLLYLALLLEDISDREATGEIVTTILGVEEPEAHLHPHLQRVLFRHLLSDGRPLIVTTHSPHLASVARLSSLTLLRTVDGETRAFDTRDLGLDTRTEVDLERYLDVTRAEVLFAKGVILVEGAAEQFLIPAFSSSIGFDLDAHGVTVCAVHGTDFVPYRRLLSRRGLNIPSVVITDGDPDAGGTLDGVTRGRRLVAASHRSRVDAALAAGDPDTARSVLRRRNVFVGSSTLELDLLPAGRDAMVAAYAELEPSATKRNNFAQDLDAHSHGDTTRDQFILARLTSVGKGRYAQRLAGHLDDVAAPDYITKAIERIRSKVGPPIAAPLRRAGRRHRTGSRRQR